jgi:negative regulator of replication initiation
MELKHLTVGLRPELYQYFEAHAKDEGVSISRYVTRLLEMTQGNAEDEVVPYSKEELDKSIREAEEAIQEVKSGKLKAYETTEELFQALGI